MVARKARSKGGRLVRAPGHSLTSCMWIARATSHRQMTGETLYDVIGMDEGSSLGELRAAAKSLLSRSHPDLGGDASGFAGALAAWGAFKDEASRAAYDASIAGQAGEGRGCGACISFADVDAAGRTESNRMSLWKDPWELVDASIAESWADALRWRMWDARACVEFEVGVASSATRWWIDGGVAMVSSSAKFDASDASVCAMLIIAGFKEFGLRIVL